MKVIPGHGPALHYALTHAIKLLPGICFCFSFPLYVAAQDSLKLRSIGDSNLYYSPMVFVDATKTTNQEHLNKRPFLFAENIRFRPDTAAINDRFVPGANPQRFWYLTYPPTEDQRKAIAEEQRKEESIGWFIADQVLQSIFGRNKIPAVKPTF